jgi:HK97 family phage prohead protease
MEERAAGLWSRFRFNKTPEGESAFANMAENVYGGLSIGFRSKVEEMRNGVRTILSAHLDHVSLVETPAYADAVVLDVRSAGDPLAEWRWILEPRRPIDFSEPPSITELSRR